MAILSNYYTEQEKWFDKETLLFSSNLKRNDVENKR